MTAVIYARYSSDNQREESIEGQIRECTAYAEKNGITVVKHYIDRAISAKTDNRPEFQQMIKDSDKKLFDIVLVWKLDRFARNRYDSARYKTQLKKNGVKLMSATEIISEGPEGIILESVLEGYAEYYSADLAEKVVRGQTENILKGRCNGGRGTFGYTLDSERKFHIDPLTSPFVMESFKKYNEGSTMKEIRDWLNENGIKNPVGGAFTYNSVEHMLKNRRYIGELKFRDVVVPDAIPPIIPLELFEDVQEKIAKNKKAPARRKAEDDYLLTTKLFCGYCGALMFGESGTSRTGEVHRYYKCATAKKHKGCKKKTVRKQWLEDLVVNQTMQLVKDDAAMESIIAKVMELQNKENTNIPLYEKQLRDAESGIQNMLNAIQAGILTSSTKERLEETKRELEARIAEEKLAKPKVTEAFIQFWLLRFRKLDRSLKDQRQALVDLPLIEMHPVGLVAACTRGSNVRFRVTEGDNGVGHNGLRQAEQLFLGFHPVHLRPGAQPDCAKPQLLCGKADILSGNGSINDPVILCKAERTVKIAADEDTRSSVPQRLGRAAVGICHLCQLFRVGHHHERPVPRIDAARPAHGGFQQLVQLFVFNGLSRKFPAAAPGENGIQSVHK